MTEILTILLDTKLGGNLSRKNYIYLKNSYKVFGFSLLELSIVLMILSVVSGGGIVLYNQLSTRSKIEETKTRMKVIIEAVDDYYDKHLKIPATYAIDTPISNANFGKSSGDCTTPESSGLVPVYALRIPPEYAFDAWGNRIRYICKTTGTPDYLTIENFNSGVTPFAEATNRKPIVAIVSAGPNQKVAYVGRKGIQKSDLFAVGSPKKAHIKEVINMSSSGTTVIASPPTQGYDDITYFITLQQIMAADSSPTPQPYFEDN